jgi:hypothetical protein
LELAFQIIEYVLNLTRRALDVLIELAAFLDCRDSSIGDGE